MYHIAVCDDGEKDRNLIREQIRQMMEEAGILYQCSCFASTRELEHALNQKQEPVHLILLDILMEGKNGMEFARDLRAQGQKTSLVFITSSVDYILQGYDVQAIKYIVKPVQRKELQKAVFYDYYNNFLQNYFYLHEGANLKKVSIRDVLYMENSVKKTTVHLKQGVIVCRERLKELETSLRGEGICRCHNSFLVNLNQVTEIVRYSARLCGGKEVPISKAYYKEIQEAFMKHLEMRLNGFLE